MSSDNIATYSILSGIFYYLISSIPWSIFFIFSRIFGIYYYTLKEKETCTIIQKKLNNRCSSITDGGKGCGYSCGYWYILHIQPTTEYNSSYSVCIISTQKSFEELIKIDDDTDESMDLIRTSSTNESDTDVSVYERFGSYKNMYYRKRQIHFDLHPKKQQEYILKDIEKLYKKKSYLCIILHGNPGTGKSMLGLFLAKQLHGKFCDTMNPFEPGDTLHSLYSDVDVTKHSPLVLMLDEIDTHLENVTKGIPSHKNIPTLVQNKTGWNRMIDGIQRGLFKNFILILTTNKTPEHIRNLDPSYIRDGRIDKIYKLTDKV